MSEEIALYHTEITHQSDALQEFRVGELMRAESRIKAKVIAIHEADEVLRSATLDLGLELKAFKDMKLYEVDGYSSMTEYVRIRWPRITDARLSQLLAAAGFVELIREYNDNLEGDLTRVKSPLPEPIDEKSARTASYLPQDEQLDTYALAVEAAGGISPTAKQIAETHTAISSLTEVTESRIGRLDTSKTSTNDTISTPNEPEENERIRNVKRRGFTPQGIDFRRECIYGFYFMPANPTKGWTEKRINIWIDFSSLEELGCVMPSQQETLEYKNSGGLSPDVAIYLKGKIDTANANADRDKKRKDPVSSLNPMQGFFNEPDEDPPLPGSFLPPELAESVFSEAGI